MNPDTLKALKASIAHWKRMKRDPKCGEKPRSWNCALCARFPGCGIGGELCPVVEAVQSVGCCHTPYSAARDAFYYYDEQGGKTSLREWRTAAQREIDFLESLLPKPQRSRKPSKRTVTKP